MKLEGSSAIVTGGAGGLGAATVRQLVASGLRVVVFDRDAERAGALADELGDAAVAVSGDVTDDDDVAAAIEAARGLGALSVLVNVAGGGVGGGRTVARGGIPHDKESFVATMEMNAIGTFNVTRLVCAAMGDNEPDDDGRARRGGEHGVDRRDGGQERPGRLRRGQGRHPGHDPAHGS